MLNSRPGSFLLQRAFSSRALTLLLAVLMLVTLSRATSLSAVAAPAPPVQDEASAGTPAPGQAEKDLARLEQLIAETQASEQLDEESKTNLTKLYQDAIQAITTRQELEAQAAANQKKIEQAPTTLEQTRKTFEETPTEVNRTFARAMQLEEVEGQLKSLRQELTSEQAKVTNLEQERLRRTTRRKEIPARIDQLESELLELQGELAPLENTPEPSPAAAARLDYLRYQIARLQTERQALQVESQRYDAENDLLPLQTDLARRRALRLSEQIEILDRRMSFLRKSEAERQSMRADEFQQQFVEQDELLDVIASIKAMAEQRVNLTSKLTSAREELQRRQGELDQVQEEFKRTQARVDNLGTSSSIGSLLRKQQADLPAPYTIRDRIEQRQSLIRTVELDLYDAVDRREELSNPDARAKELAERTGLPESDILPLLQLEREIAADVESELEEYFESLVELNTTSKSMLDNVEQFSDYVDRNILWIRSNDPIWEIRLADLQSTFNTAFQTQAWLAIGPTLLKQAKQHWFLTILIAVVISVGFWKRRAMRRAIDRQAAIVGPATSTKFKPTVLTLLLTLGIAVLWPGISLLCGWLLNQEQSEYSVAWGAAFVRLGTALLGLEFIRQTCRRDGLALSHFRWPDRVVKLVRNNIWLAVSLLLPVIFLHEYSLHLESELMRANFARTTFVTMQALSIYFVFRLFQPATGVFKEHLDDYPDGWLSRTSYLWFGLMLIVPVVILGMALYGYYYTAEQLAERMRQSVGILLVLMVVSGLMTRWVLVSRRRLRLQQMRERLTQSGVELEGIPTDNAGDVDLRTINTQSKRLIRSGLVIVGIVGLLAVWSDVLPALQALDSVSIWQVSNGEGLPPTDITLKNLLLLLPIIAATIVAARNAPGLLEIAILQRLPLDASIRYAITTLASYILVTVGVVLASSTIGIQWGQVQWLVAALGVGLGFGLQEIFANFVSGIILLFERPIRVGDVVTLGDVTGVVSSIHIRATTITNWDRQDFVVPNKDLVTGRLLNWTLTDEKNRVTINVGTSYSSKPEQVTRVLYEVLEQHPLVLSDPAPLVTFENFADSSLLFVVRAHIPSLSVRLQAIHELHAAIFKRFTKEGIEIAFPQLDLHVRSVASRNAAAVNEMASG